MRTFSVLLFLVLLSGARAPVSAQSVCEVQQLYFWDFETEPTDWGGLGFGWCHEASMVGPDTARSGQYCRGTDCSSNYSSGTSYSMETPPIPLPELEPGQIINLEFSEWYRIVHYIDDSYLTVQISVESAPWTTLIERFWGIADDWALAGASLEAYAGQAIKIRFLMDIGWCTQTWPDYYPGCADGWYIDDVGIYLYSFGMSAGVDETICEGECVQLSGNVGCGVPPYNYSWSPATGLSDPTSLNPTACPDATTTYLLSVTDNADPPNSGVDTMTVAVSPVPQPGLNDTVMFVNQVLCVDPQGIYDSCYWNDNPSSSCDTCVTYTEADDYELRLTAYRGQCVVRDTMQITVLAKRGVIDQDEFWLYPNPAKTVTHIRYELLEPANVKIDLFTLNGRLVREFTRDDATDGEGGSPGEHVVEWNLTNKSGSLIANGVYICRLTATGSVSGETVEVRTKVAVVK